MRSAIKYFLVVRNAAKETVAIHENVDLSQALRRRRQLKTSHADKEVVLAYAASQADLMKCFGEYCPRKSEVVGGDRP